MEETEVVIYGDQPVMREEKSRSEMAYLILSRPPEKIQKAVTLYDIAPTILDSLGLDYSPRFPFVGNIYDSNVYKPPTNTEYAYLCERLEAVTVIL